jgi:hypothetical protein
VCLGAIVIRRWKNSKVLATAPGMLSIEQIHSAPQYVFHRPEPLNTFLEGGPTLPTVTVIVLYIHVVNRRIQASQEFSL